MPELICKILKIGKTTYYKYLKENVPIVLFLKTFSKKELEFFLNKGKFEKLEKYNFLINKILKSSIKKYIDSFKKYDRMSQFNYIFLDFYFNFLIFLNTQDLLKHNFQYLLDKYKIIYLLKDKENANLYFDFISKDIDILKNWDNNMLLLFDDLLNSNLLNLYNTSNTIQDNQIAIYHIINYFIYSNNKDNLSSKQKRDLAGVIFEDIKTKKYLDKEKILVEIEKFYKENIEDIKNAVLVLSETDIENLKNEVQKDIQSLREQGEF